MFLGVGTNRLRKATLACPVVGVMIWHPRETHRRLPIVVLWPSDTWQAQVIIIEVLTRLLAELIQHYLFNNVF